MPRFHVAVVCVSVCWIVPNTVAQQTSPDGQWFVASNDPSKFLPETSKFRNVPGSVSFLSIQETSVLLQNAPHEMNGRVVIGLPLYLPDPEGKFHSFLVVDSPLVEDPKHETEYATLFGVGIDDPTRRVRISITPRGLHAFVIGEPAAYLVERADSDNPSVYTSHYIENLPNVLAPFEKHDCGRQEPVLSQNLASGQYSSSQMRLARIAIAARAAFVESQDLDGDGVDERFDNTKAYIQDIVSDMALVFEIDFGLRIVQVAEPYRSQIIFVGSDPYCYWCAPIPMLALAPCLTCDNRGVLEANVGFSRYDIGHMISYATATVAAPGLATYSDTFPLDDCGPTTPETHDACISSSTSSSHKARSITAWFDLPNYSSYFWVDYVAHEIAHMLSAEHTFNTPDCGAIRPDAYEPGSGSTIMSYAQQCEPNFVPHADPYFHTATISRVRDFIQTIPLMPWPTGNAAPVCSAGIDYKIPLNGQITVTWDPANTNVAPISCSNVTIQLTRNPTNPTPTRETLATTANDGSASVTLPIVVNPTPARIRVKAVGSIFLDAGDAEFTLIP